MKVLLLIFVLLLASCDIEGSTYKGARKVSYNALVEPDNDLSYLNDIEVGRSSRTESGKVAYVTDVYVSALGQLCKKYTLSGEPKLACKNRNTPFEEVRSF